MFLLPGLSTFLLPGLSIILLPGLSTFLLSGLSMFLLPGLSTFLLPGLSMFLLPGFSMFLLPWLIILNYSISFIFLQTSYLKSSGYAALATSSTASTTYCDMALICGFGTEIILSSFTAFTVWKLASPVNLLFMLSNEFFAS